MRRVKKRTFSGVVCEQEVFTISDRVQDIRKAEPRQRFKTPEEREQHRINISRKKHARYFNENFSPRSLYSTLTFDVEHECHEYRDVKRIRDLFVRRLKYAYPDAVIFIYVGRGKSTHRFHIHMVSDGIPEDFTEKKWEFGSVLRIEHLRETIRQMSIGIDEGAMLIGYCPWSAIDLVSTREGITKRYGFVYVDRDEDDEKAKDAEMKRYRKDSFYWYKKVIASNGKDLD